MRCPPPRLMLLAAIVSFCSNWQFAFQITYVNTSVTTFYQLANEGYRTAHNCTMCWYPKHEWSSVWSTVVSSFYPGSILGFSLTPWLTGLMGVKKTQMIMCQSAIAGCIVHFIAQLSAHSSEMIVAGILCFGRFLIGIQAGSSLCLLPLYIIEVSPPVYRPMLSTFQQVSQALGTLLGLLIGSEEFVPLEPNRFIWLQAIAVAPTIIFFAVLLLTPSTPIHLIRNRAETVKVLDSLYFYQGDADNVEAVKAECIRHENNSQKGGISRASWKGFIIGSLAAISYAFTADDLIDTFSAQIVSNSLGDVKNPAFLSDVVSVAMGGVLVVASLFGTILVEGFGRRKLLIVGLVSSAIWNGIAVAFPHSFWGVTTAFSMTKMSIGLGAGAPAWFLTSELVEPSHVALFQSLSTGLLLCSTMFVTFFYLQLDLLIGSYSILLLASGPALLLSGLLFIFLPETQDRDIYEVQQLLSSYTFSGLHKTARVSPMYGTL